VTPAGTSAAGVRLLALGDSYTIGEGVAADERWPERLALLLGERGFAASPPLIVARTGWTTDELCAGIDEAAPRGPFDVVTLLIGVNNQYRGRGPSEYRDQFRGLLARAAMFAGDRTNHVIVLSIPDWSVTPFAAGRDRVRIATEIDELNAINRDEATRAGARYVDVTQISRGAARERELIAADGLHPSGVMYEAWASAVFPEAVKILEG
jgi:lysophospholipase L1-like esterase